MTGATGKTGRTVVQLLADRGERVQAASRDPDAGSTVGVRFDWADRATWGPVLDGADRIYLVAVTAPENVRAFVEQARLARVERVVLLSAMGVDAAPDGVPMKEVERAVIDVAPAWTVLRPNWFSQNFGESYLLPPVLARGAPCPG